METATELEIETVVKLAAADLGYSELKPEQLRVILAFASGTDVFVSLPTGLGKSLCYTVLPGVFDRVRRAEKKSAIVLVTATYVSESCTRENAEDVLNGCCQVVFISPELQLCKRRWREMMLRDPYRTNLVGFVIDEAHCVKSGKYA